jgi:hypothetical protein
MSLRRSYFVTGQAENCLTARSSVVFLDESLTREAAKARREDRVGQNTFLDAARLQSKWNAQAAKWASLAAFLHCALFFIPSCQAPALSIWAAEGAAALLLGAPLYWIGSSQLIPHAEQTARSGTNHFLRRNFPR